MNEDSEWLRQHPEQVQELLRQDGLIHGGLIIIGVYMVTPFLTAASLDLSAKVCVVAFSVAIPLLAALVLVNRQDVSVVVLPGPSLSRLRGRLRGAAPSLGWWPASGTSCGSPG